MIEQIYQQFQQQLLKFIISKVADVAIAEDILQEVFIQVINKLDALEDQTKLTPWLYQICRNKIIDYYRSKKLSTVSLEDNESHDFVAHSESGNELESDTEQLENCVTILINDLPDKFSGVLLESEIKAFKHKDIAEAKQLSLSAVKSRVQRGRALLKKQLEACCTIEFNEQGMESHCKQQCGCGEGRARKLEVTS